VDPSDRCFRLRPVFRHDLSDAGYAAILGVILLAMWRRMGRTASGRSLRGVFAAVVFFSIVYGVLVGTYFGMGPPAGSWLALLHVLDANDQRLMMWLAIGVGAAHLLYANLVAAWWRRHSATALSALGWAAVFLGGLCAGLANSYSELAFLGGTGLGRLHWRPAVPFLPARGAHLRPSCLADPWTAQRDHWSPRRLATP
jgi:V/A-type H+-transporting ATPase subunit I